MEEGKKLQHVPDLLRVDACVSGVLVEIGGPNHACYGKRYAIADMDKLLELIRAHFEGHL